MPLLPRLSPHRPAAPSPPDPAAAPKPALRRAMAGFAAEKLKLVARLKTVRWVTFFLGALNLAAIALAGILMVAAFPNCGVARVLPFAVVVVVSGIRVMAMVGAGIAQEATATTILRQPGESSVVDAVVRIERRLKYKRWLWWTRFGMFIAVLQFSAACYLMFATVNYLSYGGASRRCFLGQDEDGKKWKKVSIALCLFLAWLVLIVQCLTGNDVLRWRSFYATHDNAWKAHYSEVFDHGLREVLCCLGRAKYMSVLEEDEVYSVARLLGDLVAYRASGTGHLELLAGLALLQRHKQLKGSTAELAEAPLSRVQEAILVHPFAEAAYTGPLLDFGRNPVLFPCVWLQRQGVLTPWMRSRRPVLEGDNWWRGHATAFVKYAKLHSEALCRGRVKQAKREAAYFIVVLHELKSVVIAVRGTETPEDLITDGLCSECTLSEDDLYGLLYSEHLAPAVKRSITMSFPHYGHSGIVEAARELFMQVDGEPVRGDSPSSTSGFLSSLLGEGKECHGYKIRIVGHSLGGAIATFLGIRLYARYPNLHVFSFGTLPCMDSVIAEACTGFVTSIVYNDEFSARLSINSIMRLRASAIAALSQDASADSAMICKLARRVLLLNKYSPDNDQNQQIREGDHQRRRNRYKYRIKGGAFLCAHAVSCMVNMPNHHTSHRRGGCCNKSSNILDVSNNEDQTLFSAGVHEFGQKPLPPEAAPFTEGVCPDNLEEGYDIESQTNTGSDVVSIRESVSQLMDELPLPVEGSSTDHQEMYLPGLVIHMVPEQKDHLPLWKSWKIFDKNRSYRAYIANRESFKDIVVSPYMFLDHLPWRCHYAMQSVLEARNEVDRLNQDLINVEFM